MVGLPHAVGSNIGDLWGMLNYALPLSGQMPHVGVLVPDSLAVMPLMRQTDCIALLPSRCILPTQRSKLAVFEPPKAFESPIALEGFNLYLAWHQRREADSATQCVTKLLPQVNSY